MAAQQQMHFNGTAGCPRFEANPFRVDICHVCQNKIQAHDSASEEDVSAAIEYAADKGEELSCMGAYYLYDVHKVCVCVGEWQKDQVQLTFDSDKGDGGRRIHLRELTGYQPIHFGRQYHDQFINFYSVPSKVWTAGGVDSAGASLFVGGYMSAVNLDFLKSERVRLIVNAAPGIENIFTAHKASMLRFP